MARLYLILVWGASNVQVWGDVRKLNTTWDVFLNTTWSDFPVDFPGGGLGHGYVRRTFHLSRPRPMCGVRGAFGGAATQTHPNTYTPSRIEHGPHVELVAHLFLLQPHCSILIEAFSILLYCNDRSARLSCTRD